MHCKIGSGNTETDRTFPESRLMQTNYDVIVIGGGPAGCAAATLVAEAGWTTLLVEREKVPRFHVGESLMPETYWTFQRLGILEKMQQSEFVRKASVQFVASSGKESQPFFFKKHDPRECSTTWQVERAEFDKLLFDNAREKGAECHDETRVLDVRVADDRVDGVRLRTADGDEREVTAKVVVDATGQQALLGRRMGVLVENPDLKKAAIWNYFRGGRRDPGEHGGATLIFHTRSKSSWFWYIPLRDDVTSVGVVADSDYLLRGRGRPEEAFQEELENCPALSGRLSNAEVLDPFRIAKEFSYHTTQHAGEGWVLIGDAWGFIDPIYSSGVYFALRSGELAADCIIEGLRTGDVSAAQLGQWTNDFGAGTKWIRKRVDAYYTNEFSFGSFLREHPVYQGNLTDLLIGRIFHADAGKIFDDMQPAIERAKASGPTMSS